MVGAHVKRKPKKRAAPAFAPKAAPRADAFVRPLPPRPKRSKSVKQRSLELAEAYRIVRQSPYGERVIADLMLMCSVYHDVEGSDPIEVGRGLGRRSVGLHITKMLGLMPEHFPDEAWRVASTADEMMGLQ